MKLEHRGVEELGVLLVFKVLIWKCKTHPVCILCLLVGSCSACDLVLLLSEVL